jgi:hypothetical protein
MLGLLPESGALFWLVYLPKKGLFFSGDFPVKGLLFGCFWALGKKQG